jgi:hypothetical protein
VFSDGWIQALDQGIPASLTVDLIPWLYTFKVFGQSDKFKLMTCDGTTGIENLPIPPAVLGTLHTIKYNHYFLLVIPTLPIAKMRGLLSLQTVY